MSPTTTGRRRAAATAAVVVALLATAACGASPADPTPAHEQHRTPVVVEGTGAVTGPRTPTTGDVSAWLDGMVPTALQEKGIAGASVAVVHDGQIVAARGYGWADTGADGDDPVPVDPQDTLFRVGSVSKVLTATAVMQLVEDGRVDLDTDVEEYVDVDLGRRFDSPITLRHLLTHTAGFEERVRGLIGPPGTVADLRQSMITDPPEQLYEPGTVPAYSNYGNSLAGYVVESVTGLAFEEYVQENVLDRIGMTSSTFAQPLPAELEPRMARGYADSSSTATPFEVVGTPPAGALSASATDMADFMLTILGDQPSGEPLLAPETIELMGSPALDGDALGGLAAGKRMALGFFDESRNGHRVLGHGGDTDVFHAHLQLYPDDRTGIFVAMNSTGTTPLASLDLRESLVEQFGDRYFPSTAGDPAVLDRDTAREHAAAVAGRYTSSRALSSTFLSVAGLTGATTVSALDDGRVVVDPHPGTGHPATFAEVEPWSWEEVGGDRTLAARVGDDGAVEVLGTESAFALLPVTAAGQVAVPVLLGSVTALLLSLVGWVVLGGRRVAGLLRRRRGTATDASTPAPGESRPGRLVTVLTRVGVVLAVASSIGWVGIVLSVMQLQDPPVAALRTLQVLLALGLLAVVPAIVRLVQRLRRRAGLLAVGRSAGVVLALAGLAWFAVRYRLLGTDLSY